MRSSKHPAVSEAAVIGVPDELKGEAIVGFVVLIPGSDFNAAAISKQIVDSLGPTFRPKAIVQVPALPKTQSGKIVRRLIRQKYLGEPLGDTSTIENPASLDAFAIPAGKRSNSFAPACKGFAPWMH